jgi:hypothetical protein
MVYLQRDSSDDPMQSDGKPRVCLLVVPRKTGEPSKPASWQLFVAAVLFLLTAASTVCSMALFSCLICT